MVAISALSILIGLYMAILQRKRDLAIMRALGVVFASGRYIAGEQPDWLEGETRRYSEEARRSRGPERSSSHEPKGLW